MKNVIELFGSMVFNDCVMQARLPKQAYKQVQRSIKLGERLDGETAEIVANAMKDWAIEKGATHFYALVPADDRHHRRKARQLYFTQR